MFGGFSKNVVFRVLPRKTTHVMDIVGAGGRFNSLVARYSEYLDLGVQDKGQVIIGGEGGLALIRYI